MQCVFTIPLKRGDAIPTKYTFYFLFGVIYNEKLAKTEENVKIFWFGCVGFSVLFFSPSMLIFLTIKSVVCHIG